MTIAARLLRWYDRAKRDLPWRRDPSPYATLVSELMLQQTGVATVEPYFVRFLRRFPDIGTLARASDDDVTALWAGLGYYARARNLRRAAETVVADHGGQLPRTEAELRSLPGVGPYTAAAVAAIAFDARAFALDGNAARVLARLFGERAAIDLPRTRVSLHARGLAEVPRVRAGDFNQAVMELGATVCTPRRPRCEACPLAADCVAYREGLTGVLPAKGKRAVRPVVRVVCACVTDGTRLLVVRRGAGLLAGTWALPEAEADAGGGGRSALAVARGLAKAAGAGGKIRSIDHRGAVRHVFTHRDMTAEVFRVEVVKAAARAGASGRWVAPEELAEMGVSRFTRKTVAVGLG